MRSAARRQSALQRRNLFAALARCCFALRCAELTVPRRTEDIFRDTPPGAINWAQELSNQVSSARSCYSLLAKYHALRGTAAAADNLPARVHVRGGTDGDSAVPFLPVA